jgi:hypothetical protein
MNFSPALQIAAKTFAQEAPRAYKNVMSDTGAEKIAALVNEHALGSAAAAIAAGWIPGAGGTVALLASSGFIWAMYYRINTASGIQLSKNLVKSIASAVLTNIITQVAGALAGAVVATALSFVPGIGSVAASVIMGAIVYGTVVGAGVVYLKMLTKLFKAGRGGAIGSMSESELKSAAKSAADETDLKSVVSEAKSAYTKAKKSGEVSGAERVDIGGFEDK